MTGVTITQVRRESSGALSSQTAVLLRVEIRNISFQKKKEKKNTCIIVGTVAVCECVCVCVCGRHEVDSAERGVGN